MDVGDSALQLVSFAGSTVAIWWRGQRAGEILDFLFRRIPADDMQQSSDVAYRLTAENASVLKLYREQDILYLGSSEAEVAGRLLGDVCQALASHSTRGMVFHASALQWLGKDVMLPGTMEVGKSTLTAWLLTQGFDYLTDEMVYIPGDTGRMETFSRPLNLRHSSRFVWQHLAGGAERKGYVWSGDHFDLVQPELLQSYRGTGESSLDLIVFPCYAPDATFELHPLTKAQAGLELMKHFVNARNLPNDGFPEITRLVREVPAYRMCYSNFEQVKGQIEALLVKSH